LIEQDFHRKPQEHFSEILLRRVRECPMTTFDDREKVFENKYVHDDYLRFLGRARRNKLMGRWAAAELGLTGQAAEDYAEAVCKAGLAKAGDAAIVQKISADLERNKNSVPEADLVARLERLMGEAMQQLQREPLSSTFVAQSPGALPL
jgi:hypothetical protein